jgi:hypothetical protein
MTTTDIILRINDAMRDGDTHDLERLAATIRDLLMEERQQQAWLALIESAAELIELAA